MTQRVLRHGPCDGAVMDNGPTPSTADACSETQWPSRRHAAQKSDQEPQDALDSGHHCGGRQRSATAIDATHVDLEDVALRLLESLDVLVGLVGGHATMVLERGRDGLVDVRHGPRRSAD